MRIVHLTASALLGGPERQMLGLAGALPDECATTFLSFAEGGRCRPFLAAARVAGFDAAVLRHDTPHVYAAVREVSAFLRGNKADVLVTHGYKSNLLGRPAARQVGIPIVSVSRGWTGEDLKVRCYEALDRLHLRLMDRVVCVSDGQAAKVRRAGVAASRIRVIRNGARLREFASADPAGRERLRRLAAGPGPVVLAAGRLSPEKGFRVLIDAAHRVRNEIPEAQFVLCGEGPERPALERLVAIHGLGDRFRMAGFRPDLDSMLPWADVVALPSHTEGLPNIALEAAAAGVPVVATAVGGTPEVVVNGRTGFLVPPGDRSRLADRIIDVLRNPGWASAFGAAARTHARESFSFSSQAEAYQELFGEILAGEGRRQRSREVVCGS
jgi:glycosyltransferase involved in cell wall biosynthesis